MIEKGGKEKHKRTLSKGIFFSSFAPFAHHFFASFSDHLPFITQKIPDGSLFRHDVYINSSLSADQQSDIESTQRLLNVVIPKTTA